MAGRRRVGTPGYERQARHVENMRRQGLRRILVWVPRESVHDLRAVACLLRCWAEQPLNDEMPTRSRRRHEEQLQAEAARRWSAKDAENPEATHPAPAE